MKRRTENALGNGGIGAFDAKCDFDGETGADMVTKEVLDLFRLLSSFLPLASV
jgi:hypothetical protein